MINIKSTIPTTTTTVKSYARLFFSKQKVMVEYFCWPLYTRDISAIIVTGEWRKLHNAELHALYSSPKIIMDLRWAGHVACMEESRNAYRVLVGKPESKRPLGRPRRRWEDNIKMDLRVVIIDIG